MTPCEKLGYKVGDRFEVVDIDGMDGFTKGSIIDLYRDDNSDEPLFKLVSGHTKYMHADGKPGAYIKLERIKPTKEHVKMTDKILEAVKSLGGDLRNASQPTCTSKTLRHAGDGRYIITSCHIHDVVCTVSEFKAAAEQWLKEAYMHNAALDLDWDIENVENKPKAKELEFLIADKEWRYYGSNTEADSEISVPGWADICSVKEFIDYCNANKPCEEVKPEWSGDGLPPVGAVCTLRYMHDSKTLRHTGVVLYASRKYCILDQVGAEILCKIGDYEYEKTKSPRDKAIDAISRAPRYNMPESKAAEVYDWLKQLTPEQKKEFGL